MYFSIQHSKIKCYNESRKRQQKLKYYIPTHALFAYKLMTLTLSPPKKK